MERVLLYDPHRVPHHWVELLRPGQFAVFVFALDSVAILDENGQSSGPSDESCFIFDALDEAKQFCDVVVTRVEHVRCEVYDHHGMAIQPLATIVNPRDRGRIHNRLSGWSLIIIGLAAVISCLPLFWFDWLAAGARIWPTLIGINLIVFGGRLVMWGIGVLDQCRKEARNLDSATSR
jgi:hypothetical protein